MGTIPANTKADEDQHVPVQRTHLRRHIFDRGLRPRRGQPGLPLREGSREVNAPTSFPAAPWQAPWLAARGHGRRGCDARRSAPGQRAAGAVWRDSGRRGTGSDRRVRACGGSGPARTVASPSQVPSPTPASAKEGGPGGGPLRGDRRGGPSGHGRVHLCSGTQRWRAGGLWAAPQTRNSASSSGREVLK